jgi:fatty-acyl-CoA synthase
MEAAGRNLRSSPVLSGLESEPAMDRSSPLDLTLTLTRGATSLATAADLERFEATPYDERIAAQSTYEALALGAALDPEAPAMAFLAKADPDEAPVVVSYARLMARITQTANFFIDLGVGPNDVVSMLLPLVPQSFFALFGAQAAAIANPVNPLLSADQIAEILRAANTKVLVALGPLPGSDIWSKVQQLRGKLPALKAIVVVHGGAELGPGVHDFDVSVATRPGDRLQRARPIVADDIAAYFHTGGTTGLPKLVRHTHRNEVYQAWAIAMMLPVGRRRTVLFGLPLFHVGGALTQCLAPLAAGGTLVVLSPAGWRNPQAIRNVWRLVERYRPEMFGGVPTVIGAAMNVPIDGADVSSIRCISGGGSAIPVAVGKTCMDRLQVPVLEVYGMTETSSVHCMSYPDRPVRLGSVGHALPYSRVRVVRLDGAGRLLGDCAVGEIGVVAMAGPGVFSGYVSAAHNDSAFVAPGWVNSGDLGRLEADGTLWLTGRAKDLVIRGGHNIDPLAIEEVFFQHPAVALVAVVGQPDAHAGELPVAFVQARPGLAIDTAELLDFVRERTPERAAVPVAIYFLDAIPLTAVGKVFKPALRWEATRRVVLPQLADLEQGGVTLGVEVGPHDTHGSLITVRIGGAAEAAREPLARQVHARLDPLVTRHEIAWC